MRDQEDIAAPRGDGSARPTSPLLDELVMVHAILRRDLARCEALAREVGAGASTSTITSQLADLEAGGVLFRLHGRCLGYCQLVHLHHSNEDTRLFPVADATNPELESALQRLRDDHIAIAHLLDEVELAADSLEAADLDPAAPHRTRLVQALVALADDLIDHLDREETTLAPVFAGWGRWPQA